MEEEKALASVLKEWTARDPDLPFCRPQIHTLGSKQHTEKATFFWVSQAQRLSALSSLWRRWMPVLTDRSNVLGR